MIVCFSKTFGNKSIEVDDRTFGNLVVEIEVQFDVGDEVADKCCTVTYRQKLSIGANNGRGDKHHLITDTAQFESNQDLIASGKEKEVITFDNFEVFAETQPVAIQSTGEFYE